MYRVAPRLALGAIVLYVVGCDSSPTSPDKLPSAAQPVMMAAEAVTVLVGEKIQLRPSSQLSRSRTVRWKSSDNNIAQAGASGVVVGEVEGDVIVTATGNSPSVTEQYPVKVRKIALVGVTAAKSTLTLGETTTLSAAAIGSDGDTLKPQQPFVWSVASGTAISVASDGKVTASEAGAATVAATVGGVTGATMLTVTSGPSDPVAPQVTAFVMTPDAPSVQAGNTIQFATSATWSDGASRAVQVTYTATGGTIDLSGLFRAAQVAGTFSVIANCSCGKADTSTVTVLASAAPATLVSLALSPKPAYLNTGSSQQFSVSSQWSDGVSRAVNVSYTATGGSVTSTGLYTAPSTAGTYKVIAAHSGGTLQDTATVNVTAVQTGGPLSYVVPTLPQAFVNTSYPTLTGVSRVVNAGGNLQAALDAAQPGDEVVLANGATFTGNYTLPAKSGNGYIVVRAQTVTPSAGTRATPGTFGSRAKILTPNSQPAISAARGTAHWRLVGLEVSQVPGLSIQYGLIALGNGDEPTLAEQPSDIVLDRMYIHGLTEDPQKRCVQFNGRSLAVIDSWLSDCHGKGYDSQGVAGWAGAGPYLIENNHIEGAGQGILFGGADPVIANVSPSDIIIRRNHIYKPLAWANGKWTVKATIEMKNAKRLLIEGNVLENHWADAQVGFALLLFSQTDNEVAKAWTTVQDVTFRNNIMKVSRGGINISAGQGAPGTAPPPNRTSRVLVTNNLFVDVGKDPVMNDGQSLVQLLGDVRDITLLSNTFYLTGATGIAVSLTASPASPMQRLNVVNNVFANTTYGLTGDGVGIGLAALAYCAPDAVVKANVFPGEVSPYGNMFPSGNYFPAVASSILFTSPVGGDYSLTNANSFFQSAFGRIGLNNSDLQSAVAGVVN